MSVFADAAPDYWSAGWRGIFPLPANKKDPPPEGLTGAGGRWPSYADVMAWAEDVPDANIGIRMPPDVIGIDVDTYDGKQGVTTIQRAIREWGDLPETWVSTARDPYSFSGIRLYRVPFGLRWPGQVGPDVEIIQTRHRYMVAPPSFHPTGRVYEWYAPVTGRKAGRLPFPTDLPPLPDAWVAGLTAGALATDVDKVHVERGDVASWLMRHAGLDPCRVMFRRLERTLEDLVSAGSRHDTATRAVMAFAHLAHEGHRGAPTALAEFKRAWLSAVTSGVGARTPEAAEAEWWRLLSGAVAVVLAHGPRADDADPCDYPLVGILPSAPTGSRSGATLPAGAQQGGAAPPPLTAPPKAPPGQGSDAMLPPPWVTEGAIAPQSIEESTEPPTEEWDKHAVAVALELERLEVRRDARLELTRAEHLKTWREPPSYSLRELLALPDEPLAWRVHDVMPAGANVLLAAQFKAGKTTLINELARALADGTDFLDSYKVPDAARVALFNYEVGQAQYGRWLRDRGIAQTDSVHVFNLRGFALPLSVPLVRDHIVRWLSDRGIRVWIIDPFARAFSGSGDENSNADVGPFLEILDQIKEEAGVAELVMPTHTGRAEFAPGAERARGATRLDDWCDVRWLLTRDDEGVRYFRATGRDVETDETRLEFDPLSRALTLGEGSRPRRAGKGDFSRQNATQSVEDMVLEVCADEPGATQRKIRAEARNRGLHVNNIAVAEAARRLAQQGRLRLETRPLGNGRSISAHYVVGDVPYAGDSE